jgi:hypothetical protein
MRRADRKCWREAIEKKAEGKLRMENEMNPAKLSPEFIKQPAVRLKDLKPGESGWVSWLEMAVDLEYCCYIDPKAKVSRQTFSTIQVTCTGGGFEVLIPANASSPFRWKLGGYNPAADKDYARYVPVVKLTYEEAGEKEA